MQFIIEGLAQTPLWMSVTAALVFAAAAHWVAEKYEAPGAYGLAAIVIVAITISSWLTASPGWTSSIAAAAAIGLFVTGMLRAGSSRTLHLAALTAAIGLKPVLAGFEELRQLSIPVDLPVLAAIAIAFLVGLGLRHAWSGSRTLTQRVRNQHR